MEYQVSGPASAPAADVWRLLADVERWPQLNRNVTEIRRLDRGPLQVGSEAVVRQPRLPKARWRVTELEPGRMFVWETSSGGVTSVGLHQVEPAGQGSAITIGLRLRGPLAGLVGALIGRRIRRSIALELEGFQRGDGPARG